MLYAAVIIIKFCTLLFKIDHKQAQQNCLIDPKFLLSWLPTPGGTISSGFLGVGPSTAEEQAEYFSPFPLRAFADHTCYLYCFPDPLTYKSHGFRGKRTRLGSKEGTTEDAARLRGPRACVRSGICLTKFWFGSDLVLIISDAFQNVSNKRYCLLVV